MARSNPSFENNSAGPAFIVLDSPGQEFESLNIQLLVDSIPAEIHTARPDGYLNYFNKPWLEYLGVTLDDGIGWKWTAFVHPEDVAGPCGEVIFLDEVGELPAETQIALLRVLQEHAFERQQESLQGLARGILELSLFRSVPRATHKAWAR